MLDLNVFSFVVIIIALALTAEVAKKWLQYAYSGEGKKKIQKKAQVYDDLVVKTERLEDRIYQLERILDREAPGWEKRV